MSDVSPVRDFINTKLGGDQAAAERLGRKLGTIRMWAHRKSVPRPIWPEILEAYHNVTLGDLKALESGQREAA